jgi:Methionine biosynthesis protein MetW
MEMVVALLREVGDFSSVTDVGCGDGSLLRMVREEFPAVRLSGIDMGEENVGVALREGLDVTFGNFFIGPIPPSDLMLCTEVVEHLVDPHGFLATFPGTRMVISSPVAEDAVFHYPHHAWAWDFVGYSLLVEGAGWKEVRHVVCDASEVTFNGVTRQQGFQAIYAVRA